MRYNPVLSSLPTYPTVALDRIRDRMLAEGRTVYDFGTGDPTEPAPSFVKERLCTSIPDNCRYPSVVGDPAVRTAFAGWARRRFGVTLNPDTQVLPSSGSKEAIFHLPLLVIDPAAPDRGVVYPDPGYSVYHRSAVFAGAEPIAQVLEGDFVQRPWELPDEVLARTRLLWINSPHNPTGAVLSRDDLSRTWELCRKHDILLASDECYADTWFDAPPPSILEVAPSQEGVVAVFSLSKRSGMTGYRTGMIAGDPDVMARLRTLRSNPGLAPQDFVNAAAAVAWSDDAHADVRRAIFREKRSILLDFFSSVGLEVRASDASFYLWVRAPRGLSGQAYAEHLLAAGILTYPGSAFAIGRSGDGYIRVALVPDPATCRVAVEAWRQIETGGRA